MADCQLNMLSWMSLDRDFKAQQCSDFEFCLCGKFKSWIHICRHCVWICLCSCLLVSNIMQLIALTALWNLWRTMQTDSLNKCPETAPGSMVWEGHQKGMGGMVKRHSGVALSGYPGHMLMATELSVIVVIVIVGVAVAVAIFVVVANSNCNLVAKSLCKVLHSSN